MHVKRKSRAHEQFTWGGIKFTKKRPILMQNEWRLSPSGKEKGPAALNVKRSRETAACSDGESRWGVKRKDPLLGAGCARSRGIDRARLAERGDSEGITARSFSLGGTTAYEGRSVQAAEKAQSSVAKAHARPRVGPLVRKMKRVECAPAGLPFLLKEAKGEHSENPAMIVREDYSVYSL